VNFIEVKKYDLPDFQILSEQEYPDFRYFIWKPDRYYLILGSSNKAETSLIVENVLNDQIPVYKRPSGGESVLLGPDTLVLSTLIHTQKLEDPPKHFHDCNIRIMNALTEMGVKNISQKGISDIAIGNKKIAGSSIYRKTNIVFYHAVLNVAESPEKLEKYLAMPSKQPDYRQNRPHHEFVTSLKAEGYDFGEQFPLILERMLNHSAP